MHTGSLLPLLAAHTLGAVQASSDVHIHLRIHQKAETPKPTASTAAPSPQAPGSAEFDAGTYWNDSSVDYDTWYVGNESFDLAWTTEGSEDGQYIGPWGQCGGNDYNGPTECIPGWLCAVVSEWYSQCQLQIVIDMSAFADFNFSGSTDLDGLDGQVPTVLVQVDGTNQSASSSSDAVLDAPSSDSPETPSPPLTPQDFQDGSGEVIEVIVPIAGPWAQCGGEAMDLSSLGIEALPCADGYQCTVINEWYWQCVLAHEDEKVSFWGQCGGQNYSGLTECDKGSTCVGYNEWYSQCVPNQQ